METGSRHRSPAGDPPSLMPTLSLERLMKLCWSTVWEFQERLSQSWALEDNVVLRSLQTSMKELKETLGPATPR